MQRVTLTLDDHTVERLQTLAGSPRKLGDYVTRLVAAAWENEQHGYSAVSMEQVHLQIVGLCARMKEMELRLMKVERWPDS